MAPSSDLTTAQAAQAAGITMRQLEYLVTTGLVHPKQRATGTGSKRRWGAGQVRHLRMAAVLRELGATEATMRPAMRAAEQLPEGAWNARVLVTRDGRIATLLGADANGWSVDLAHCRDSADAGRVFAVA